jgi:hypothetical protein
MKRCPKCYQPYADSERFCESDGEPLLTDIGVTSPVGKVADTEMAVLDPSAQKREMRMMVIIGVMVGIIVTSLGYAGYSLFMANHPAEEENLPVSRVETVQPHQPTRPTRDAVIEPSPAPEEEASPSPEAEAEAEESPAAQAETVAARLNQGPVSTGEREQKRDERSDKTIIEMDDGTRLEVDAAWQDKQGVWYRRGGLVSFVESKRIKGIHARQEPKSDATNNPIP